jgi:hypothetical protein
VHRAAFSAAEVAVQADGRGGLYDLALLVGDAAVANPIEWRLGQVGRMLWLFRVIVLAAGTLAPLSGMLCGVLC